MNPAVCSREGFSLIELVVVLSILAVIVAVTAPRFVGMGEINERFFFNDTLSAVRYAQKLAVATRCGVQVTIAANTYTLNLQDGCAGSNYTTAVPDPTTGASGYSNTAPSGVSLSSTLSPIRFDALGRALNSGGSVTSATITVGALNIAVVGESGFVHES
jgi:MSHA pilin protein MshC